jgi:hypothetical protein
MGFGALALTLKRTLSFFNRLTRRNIVTPAKAGVHNILKKLDSGFRRNDVTGHASFLSYRQWGFGETLTQNEF